MGHHLKASTTTATTKTASIILAVTLVIGEHYDCGASSSYIIVAYVNPVS